MPPISIDESHVAVEFILERAVSIALNCFQYLSFLVSSCSLSFSIFSLIVSILSVIVFSFSVAFPLPPARVTREPGEPDDVLAALLQAPSRRDATPFLPVILMRQTAYRFQVFQ